MFKGVGGESGKNGIWCCVVARSREWSRNVGRVIPFDASGQLVPGDITAQTHQVLKNLTAILATAGCTLADVVKCSIFVKDLGNFATINQVYGSYFDEATAPARETVEVARLPRDVEVEISCIAVGA